MPRLVPFRLAAACALALMLTLSLVATATAKGPVADLRVVGKGGKVLAEDSFGVAGEASVATSPKATCFGTGTGGSGKKVKIKTATALGMLMRAAEFTASLKPLLVSDHFDFGLALCGVGSSVAKGKASWYLKVNHKSPSVGGEAVKLHAGDEVLWDLAPSYPYPGELSLVTPGKVAAGKPFQVRVFSYDEKGKKTPASGVTVSGASGPTDAAGKAMVTLAAPAKLIARGAGEIPSGREPVCVGGKCPGSSGR
jgi:Domain of unknown function (DUF4430)